MSLRLAKKRSLAEYSQSIKKFSPFFIFQDQFLWEPISHSFMPPILFSAKSIQLPRANCPWDSDLHCVVFTPLKNVPNGLNSLKGPLLLQESQFHEASTLCPRPYIHPALWVWLGSGPLSTPPAGERPWG